MSKKSAYIDIPLEDWDIIANVFSLVSKQGYKIMLEINEVFTPFFADIRKPMKYSTTLNITLNDNETVRFEVSNDDINNRSRGQELLDNLKSIVNEVEDLNMSDIQANFKYFGPEVGATVTTYSWRHEAIADGQHIQTSSGKVPVKVKHLRSVEMTHGRGIYEVYNMYADEPFEMGENSRYNTFDEDGNQMNEFENNRYY